jgi:hypothetical protein
MSFLSLLNRTATITSYGPDTIGTDGRPAQGSATTTTAPCRLQQETTEEITVGQTTYRSAWRAFLPAGVAIDGSSTLSISGRAFSIVGQPWEVDGATSTHHIEVRLAEVSG